MISFLNIFCQNSVELAGAQYKLEQALAKQEVARKKYSPTIDAILEGTKWTEETGSRDSAMIGLRLRVPLVGGAGKRRDERVGRIDVENARIELNNLKNQLRERAFELWQRLTVLHLELDAANIKADYRDQYMDRSRTLYELEEVADLGDAQAEQLRAIYEINRVRYQIAVVWGEVNLMTGLPVWHSKSNE